MKKSVKSRIEGNKSESYYTNMMDCKIQSFFAFIVSNQLRVWCKYCDHHLTTLYVNQLPNPIGIGHHCPVIGYYDHDLKWR